MIVNGGDERTDDVVESMRPKARARDIQIELVKTVNKNLAASRNVGLSYCKGDIIAMTDDDAEVFPDWITHLKRLHDEHPEAGAIGGETSVFLPGRLSDAPFPDWLRFSTCTMSKS